MVHTTSQVQERLKTLGYYKGDLDGIKGPQTLYAIEQFQSANGLVRDGAVGPKTAARLFPASKVPSGKFYIGTATPLSDDDFKMLANKHGIEEAKIRAVNAVEAAGKGFVSSGAIVCLYEPHVAFKHTSGATRAALVADGLAYKAWKAGSYPKTSYDRIDRCTEIAGAEVACLSTSWGLGQIMGFNFAACGYESALRMVEAFAISEAYQLQGMIRFIKANAGMFSALQDGNWATFAKAYNGSGFKKNKYDTKLAAAYARFKA